MGVEIEATAYWLGWVNLVKLVAFFIVAVGVVLEFGAELVGKPLERKIEAARELRIAELNALVSGRQLTDDQIAKIGAALKPFSDRQLLLSSYTGDAEAVRLGFQIRKALELAKIKVETRLGSTLSVGGDAAFGIAVSSLPGPDEPFAKAITKALQDDGKLLQVERRVTVDPKATFGIMILLRPL